MRVVNASQRSAAWAVLVVLLLPSGCFTLLGGGGGPPSPPPFSATSEWHASNGPLLAEYLKTLPPSAIGQPLKGIRLSGDSGASRWLEGQVYLGVPAGLPEGVGARLVDDGQRVIAFVWVEDGADALTLEPCETGEQAGIRARLAGGGPFAWKQLRAVHGVVYTVCPPEGWVPPDALRREPNSAPR
ncbi:MAG TPA: hypothetical protein EYG54_05975 [Myxococcales bacterium]|nr:hypothetical protein [Myxococcales bacterium]